MYILNWKKVQDFLWEFPYDIIILKFPAFLITASNLSESSATQKEGRVLRTWLRPKKVVEYEDKGDNNCKWHV